MPSILEMLNKRSVLVSDGAWGTFLVQKGMKPGECPELWNVDHPYAVADIARAYGEAGSDLVSTNTFGATRFKLAHFGLGERAAELNEAAAKLSRQSIAPEKAVFASMGPTGKILMMGDVTEDDLYEAFREQAVALERGGADALCVETMTALDEAGLAVRAAKESTSLPVICTFTFDKTGHNEYRTMMGVSPADMAGAMIEAGADVVGSNCGQGPAQMVDIVKQIAQAVAGVPVMVQANAGLPIRQGDTDVFPETPEHMAGFVEALVKAGARIVGGCCGTTPEHIKAIVEAVKRLS